MMKVSAALLAAASPALAAVESDLVKQLPEFPVAPFKIYSGYLEVPDYGGPYTKLKIHYQFHEAQSDAASKPVATWHQGGPGGSSLYGLYGEMGYFQIENGDAAGSLRYRVNPYAWNRVANMLYLESPAGSDDPLGFSYCEIDGKIQSRCTWSDVTQAEAYAHTLKAFFLAFPEYANNDLYLTGESYAGQYLPNIATYILNNTAVVSNLKGIAVGNGCWGGSAHSVQCNGPNSEQNDIDTYYGKGMISKKMYQEVQAACNWPKFSIKCEIAQEKAFAEVGPHNVYNVYDTCPLGNFEAWHKKSGKSVRFVHKYRRDAMDKNIPRTEQNAYLSKLGGGMEYGCGQEEDMGVYFRRTDVQQAMNLGKPGISGFGYRQSGPASQLLYPDLVKKLRVLIYDGDADMCVPYKGNEEWTTALEASGAVQQTKAWHPWYATDDKNPNVAPAGYVTNYKATSSGLDFSFVTIRLAGHMVPAFTPGPAFFMIKRFLEADDF